MLLPMAVFAQKGGKRAELEKQRKALEIRIEQTKKVLTENKKQQESSISQLHVIGAQIKTREAIIDNIGQQIFELSLEVQSQRKVIDQLKADLDSLKADYANQIREAYKRRGAIDQLVFIFNSKDFNQAYKRVKYLGQYSKYRQQQAQLILKTQKSMIAAINEIIAIKQVKMRLIDMKEAEKKLLVSDQENKKLVLIKLQKSEQQLRVELSNQQKVANRLAKAINDLIAKEIAEARRKEEARRKAAAEKARKEALKSGKVAKTETKSSKEVPVLSPEMLKLSSDFEANKGRLPWPVNNGFVAQSFGVHSHPTLKGVKTNNNGIDIAVKQNSEVRVIFKGTVKAIFSVPGMERVILVNHGAYYSVYANLETIQVKIGDELKTGDVLGVVFTNEELGRTQVHLEIYNQKELQNPALWLKN